MIQRTLDFDAAPATEREGRTIGERECRTIQERFEAWLEQGGQDVYREFVAIARQLRAAGHEHYGAKSILEILRYHRAVRGPSSDPFRINNVYGSRLARMAMKEHADLAGMFETRELKSE